MRWSDLPVGQHYKVTMSTHCRKSVLVPIYDMTIHVARSQNPNNQAVIMWTLFVVFSYRCMGITETVFTPRSEVEPGPIPVPLSALKQQIIAEQKPILLEGEVGKCPPKIKRAKETNRLETGPPTKIRRIPTVDQTAVGNDSSYQRAGRRTALCSVRCCVEVLLGQAKEKALKSGLILGKVEMEHSSV